MIQLTPYSRDPSSFQRHYGGIHRKYHLPGNATSWGLAFMTTTLHREEKRVARQAVIELQCPKACDNQHRPCSVIYEITLTGTFSACDTKGNCRFKISWERCSKPKELQHSRPVENTVYSRCLSRK